MALSQEELQSVVNAVLSSIRTNSKTIGQLTPAISINGDDCFEIDGGKKVPLSLLKELLVPSSYPDNTDALLHVIRAGFRAIGAAFWDSNEPFPSGNAVIDSSRLGLAAVNGNVCLYLASNIGKVLPVSFNYRNGGEAATGNIPANGNTMIVLDGSRFSGNDNIVVNVGSLDALGGSPYYIGMVAISENSTPALRGNFTQLQKRVTNVEEEVMSQGGDIAELQRFIEEVNVSKIFPTGGIDGTNKYTLETAIAKIPASLRNVGIKCSFLDEGGELETWEYIGNAFTALYNWVRIEVQAQLSIGIYDIDKLVPLNTGYYTLETAINATPSFIKYNKKSGIILFGTGDGRSEMWQLKNGMDWWGLKNWVKIEPNMYYPLTWDGSINATYNSLPQYSRKNGMIVSYTQDGVLKYFLYTGENYATSNAYYDNFVRMILYDEYEVTIKSSFPFYRNIVLTDYSAKKDGSNSTGAFKGYEIDLATLRDKYNVYQIIFRSSFYRDDNNIVNYIVYNNSGTIIDYYASNKGNYTNEWCTYTIKEEDEKMRVTYLPTIGGGEYGERYTPEGCYVLPNEYSEFVRRNEAEYSSLVSLNNKLYTEEVIAFEDKENQNGSQTYEYDNIGLVHNATKVENFNQIKLYITKPNSGSNQGQLIVKTGTTVSASGGTVVYQVEADSNNFPEYPNMMEISLPNTVRLNSGEKLWVYFTGHCSIRRWKTTEKPELPGMYFQGRESENKSTPMILIHSEGDILRINKEIEELKNGGGDGEILEYFPTDLYVPTKTMQTFYWNQMMLGDESRTDDSFLNYKCTITFPSAFKGKCFGTDEGFSIYHDTAGEFNVTIRVYDSYLNVVVEKTIKIHIVEPLSSVTKKNILMMGASWVDITTTDGSYVYFLDKALKEQGVELNFVGSKMTKDTNQLKYEAVGGSTYEYWCGSSSPFYDSEASTLNVTKYRTETLQLLEQLDYVYIQLGGNEATGGNVVNESSFNSILWNYAQQLYDAILADSPNCKIFVYLPSNCSPGMTGMTTLSVSTNGYCRKLYSTYIINKFLIQKISERNDFNKNLFLSQDHYGLSRRYGFGYIDARYRYFKVDFDSMEEDDKTKMLNYDYVNDSIFMKTGQEGFGEFSVQYYDKRGYIVAQIQRGLLIQGQNELIVSDNSISNDKLPVAGTLTKSGGSSSADYPDIPFTEVLLENNDYKKKWYTNGTHPSIGGYEQLGYCNAAQLLAFL